MDSILGGGALEQLHGSFSDIGAHQDFQKPEFLLKELWFEDIPGPPGLPLVGNLLEQLNKDNMKHAVKVRYQFLKGVESFFKRYFSFFSP